MKTIAILFSLFLAGSYNRADWISQSQWNKERKHVLARDVVNGHWVCRYSGIEIDESKSVDIDHIIPLKYAFEIGGDKFSEDKKHQFATDDSNLVSVSEHENRSKGDKGLNEYVPPKNSCFYFRHWAYVSKKYDLKILKQDSIVLSKGLKNCADSI